MAFSKFLPFKQIWIAFTWITFYSVLTVFIFLYDYQFLFSFSPLLLWLFLVLLFFVFVIAIIISSFSMFLTFIFLVFTILFYLCIYRIFLNFKQMTWQNIVQSWQQRQRDCISFFNGNFELFNLDLSCCWVICISFVTLLHIDKASEKKGDICAFNKLCVFI